MLSILPMPAKQTEGPFDGAAERSGVAFAGERVEFASRRGGLLVGDLHRDHRSVGPMLLLCHGMESTRQGTKQQAVVERFLPLGFSVFRFDFSYVGESDGRFEELTVSGEVEDALGAIDFVQDFAPTALVVVGSSLGGTVALLAAARTPERVHAIATIAAVADAALFTSSLDSEEIASWRREGRRRWREGYMNLGFLEDVERIDILAAVSSLPAAAARAARRERFRGAGRACDGDRGRRARRRHLGDVSERRPSLRRARGSAGLARPSRSMGRARGAVSEPSAFACHACGARAEFVGVGTARRVL